MGFMFENCSSLKSLQLSNFKTSMVKNMEAMFSECHSLMSLNLSNFDTSSVIDMFDMFSNCYSLKELEIDNFDTSKTIDMSFMFYNCSSLISLNLYNFNLSSSVDYSYILSQCNTYLIYCINNNSPLKEYLSEFEFTFNCSYFCLKKSHKIIYETNECTFNCYNDNLFEYNNTCYNKCPNGTIISSDNTHMCIDKSNCNYFYNYEQTECISDIPKGYFLNDTNHKTIDKCHEDCETCIQKYTLNNTNCLSCKNSKFLDLGNCISNCPNGYNVNSNICKCPNGKCLECSIESLTNDLCISCNTEDEYFPKYNDSSNVNPFINCYKEPEGYFLSNNIYHKCYHTCKKCNGYGNEINHQCTECKINYVFINDSQINNCYNKSLYQDNSDYITEAEESDDISTILYFNVTDEIINDIKIINTNLTEKDEIIKDLKNQIMNGSLDSFIENLIQGEKKDLMIKDDNIQYQMTSTENQKNNKYDNISNIILGECENILKKEYKINTNLPLIMLKVDYYQPGSLIPIIGYEVFHPITKIKLNLTYCKDSLVNFNIPVNINEDDLFKYDPNNEYYTNECYPSTSDSGTDILINDRQNEYNNNNMSLCENNCTFNGYDGETKKSICECAMKTKQLVISELVNNTDILSYNFTNTDKSSNMITMKCYYTLFTKNGLLKNIGSYILLFTILLIIISGILFHKCGYHSLEDDIKDIMDSKEEENKNKDIKRNETTDISNSNKTNKTKKVKKKRKIIKKKKIKNINSINMEIKVNSKSLSKLELKSPNEFIKEKTNEIKFNNYEINSLSYNQALIYDKRKFISYYISLIRTKHPLLFSFCPIDDYNSMIIKIDLFFLSFCIYCFISSLFFDEKTIHKIYEDEGIYNFIFLIPHILYSFIVSHTLFTVVKYFSLSERNILEIKKEKNIEDASDKMDKVKRCLIIKYLLFFILSILFLLFFWYYLSSFCAVYQNTQIYLIKNILISFGFSLVYPFAINLIPGILRIYSLIFQFLI